MARSKPTRSIELTFAKISQTNNDGTLFPCYIAPRYVLHKLAEGNTLAGQYTGVSLETLAYPYKSTDIVTEVDTANIVVKLTKALVCVGSNISASLKKDTKNCLVFTKAVAGEGADNAVANYDIRIGDIIKIGTTKANIIDIRADETDKYTEIDVDTTSFSLEGTVDVLTYNLCDVITLSDNDYKVSDKGITLTKTDISIDWNNKSCAVAEAEVHIEYRECIQEGTFELLQGNTGGLDDFLGVVDPLNPLAFMAYCARLAETNAFYVMSVPDNSYSSYEKAINIALRLENVFAPITYNQSEPVRKFLMEQLKVYNSPEVAQHKKLWFVDNTDDLLNVYEQTADGESLKMTMSANGAVTFANGDLLASGVRIKDKLIIPSYYDAQSQSYIRKEFVIKSVEDTDSLTVANGIDIVSDTPAIIARDLTNYAYANTVGNKAADYDSPFINYVWADTPQCIGFGVTDKVYLLATLAALRAKHAPHAPLSEVTVPGWTVSDKRGMSEGDLDLMNEKGVWIVYKDRYGEVVTRHQITTVQDGTLAEEDSAVSNACNIVRSMRSMLYQYRGDANVTNELIDALNADIRNALDRIMARVYSFKIGRQITDYKVKNIQIDRDNRARIILDTDIDVPEPLLDGHFKFNII